MKTVSSTSKATKSNLKAAVARVRKNVKALEKEEKGRGRFAHPAGIKEGSMVSLMIRRGAKMVRTQGIFQYCNRNSVAYGVIKVNGKIVERALSKFEPVVVMNSKKATARVAKN